MCCLSLPPLALGFDNGIIRGNRGVRLLPTCGAVKKGKKSKEEKMRRSLYYGLNITSRTQPPLTLHEEL